MAVLKNYLSYAIVSVLLICSIPYDDFRIVHSIHMHLVREKSTSFLQSLILTTSSDVFYFKEFVSNE